MKSALCPAAENRRKRGNSPDPRLVRTSRDKTRRPRERQERRPDRRRPAPCIRQCVMNSETPGTS